MAFCQSVQVYSARILAAYTTGIIPIIFWLGRQQTNMHLKVPATHLWHRSEITDMAKGQSGINLPHMPLKLQHNILAENTPFNNIIDENPSRFIRTANIECGEPVMDPDIQLNEEPGPEPEQVKDMYALPRIVGGGKAIFGGWPWMAQIKIHGSHECGGAIVNEYWVVSAAHCFLEPDVDPDKPWITVPTSVVKVHTESTSKDELDLYEQIHAIDKLIVYPKYNTTTANNDIALLKLKKRLVFSERYVRPICIPRLHALKPGTICFIAGYGETQGTGYDDELKQAPVLIMPRRMCKSKFIKISNNVFCAGHAKGGIDACGGDSGGPLICKCQSKYYLYGIVSWGEGCAERNKPGFYTKVGKFYNWISRYLKPNTGW